MSKDSKKYKEMIDSWRREESKETYYISKEDFKHLNEFTEDVKKYNAINKEKDITIYPQPWWGNIDEPKIIVLGKNPSYTYNEEEIECKKFSKDLINNLNASPTINWLDKEYRFQLNKTRMYCTFKFWQSVFKDIIKYDKESFEIMDDYYRFVEKGYLSEMADFKISYEDALKSIRMLYLESSRKNKEINNDLCKNIYKKIGFFNFCGYHSPNYDDIKKCLGRNRLETQSRMIAYLTELLDASKLIIIIWGSNLWEEVLDLSKYKEKVFIVNKTNAINNSIVEAFKDKNREQFIRNFQEFLEANDETVENCKIEEIKKIITIMKGSK